MQPLNKITEIPLLKVIHGNPVSVNNNKNNYDAYIQSLPKGEPGLRTRILIESYWVYENHNKIQDEGKGDRKTTPNSQGTCPERGD